MTRPLSPILASLIVGATTVARGPKFPPRVVLLAEAFKGEPVPTDADTTGAGGPGS